MDENEDIESLIIRYQHQRNQELQNQERCYRIGRWVLGLFSVALITAVIIIAFRQ